MVRAGRLVPTVVRKRDELRLLRVGLVAVCCLAALGVVGAVAGVPVVGVAGMFAAVSVVGLGGYLVGRDTVADVRTLGAKLDTVESGVAAVDFSTDRTDELGQLYAQVGSTVATLQRRARVARDERDQQAALFENSGDCIAYVEIVDGTPEIRTVNAQFEERFGCESAAVAGESLVDLVVPEQQTAEVDEILAQIRRGERVKRQVRRETPENDREFLARFVPGASNRGAPADGYVVYTDITERTEARRTLEATNHTLQRLQEITADRTTGFEETVQRLLALGCERFGLEVGILSRIEGGQYDVVAAVDADAEVTAGDRYALPETICEITVGSGSCDVIALSDIGASDYRTHPAYVEGFPEAYLGVAVVVDGEVYGTLNFSSRQPTDDEFTGGERELLKLFAQWVETELERRQRERALRRSRDLLEQSQRLANVGAWEYDARTGEITRTDEVYRIHGWTVGATRDLEAGIQSYHPEDRPQLQAAVTAALEDAEPYDLAVRLDTDDETAERWVRAIGNPVRSDDEVVTLQGALQDITERKQREQRLELAEALFENTQDALFVNTVDTEADTFLMERVNPAFEEQTGLTSEDIHGRDVRDLFGETEGTAMVQNNRECIERGEPIEYEETVSVPDEGQIWQTRMAPIVGENDVERIVGSTRNITERKDSERELRERERELVEYKEYTNDILDAIEDVFYVVDDDGYIRRWNQPLADVLGYSDDELASMRGEDCHPPEYHDRIARERAAGFETGSLRFEAPFQTKDGDLIPYEFIADQLQTPDGEPVVAGIGRDISDRRQYEGALHALHETTRDLLHTESATDICETVIDIAAEIIDVPGVGIHRLDADENAFVAAAASPGFLTHVGAPNLDIGDEDSPVWTAFITGETVVVGASSLPDWLAGVDQSTEQIYTTTRVDPSEQPATGAEGIQQAMFVPVGDHGVFTAITTESGIDSRTRRLVETLVATTAAAFDRLESESSLREQERQLQARNRQLERQMQITDIIRTVDRSLVDATSRGEIQTAVCDRLVESDLIAFAWMGAMDAAEETVVPQTWAGNGHRYLDSVSLSGGQEPAYLTATTDTPTVVERLVDGLHDEPWRKEALEHGFQSVLSVPVRHGDYVYGVLTVYVPETGAFSDLERAVFAELGETVGNAINAIQTAQAVYGDSVVELKLAFSDEESLLLKLADEADCRVEYEGLSDSADGTTRLFFDVSGADSDTVGAVLDGLVAVTDYREISSREDGGHFEATVSEGLIAATLVPQGVRPRSAVAEDGQMTVVVDVPVDTDVREFVQLLGDRYPSATLVARRDVERTLGNRADLVASLLASLTDRQREALTTAYYSGFFEWPRDSTGEEVAAMLDLSQPTVNRHLRLGQRALLGELFDGNRPSTAPPA